MFGESREGLSLEIMSESHQKRFRRYFSLAKHVALCGPDLREKAPEGDKGFWTLLAFKSAALPWRTAEGGGGKDSEISDKMI